MLDTFEINLCQSFLLTLGFVISVSVFVTVSTGAFESSEVSSVYVISSGKGHNGHVGH
jgi:hypothetical protein